ncbi:MAG: hypothetical protein ACLR2M_06290 [Varibaculum sp.]
MVKASTRITLDTPESSAPTS